MKIINFLKESKKYKVDTTYQRPKNVWSRGDKQCLIDTILRDEPMPLFFLNYISKEDVYYIVDGQQRMECIKDFYNNKFPLSKKYSDSSLDGKKYSDLSPKERRAFEEYDLKVRKMQDYDDERVRMIFSRLQRGKPLGLGEKLNAKPGQIVNVMRNLAKHRFISKSIGINQGRYHAYEIVARIIFYEKYGTKDCKIDKLNELFEKYKDDISLNSDIHKKIKSVLNYLLKCFPASPGNYQYLSKQVWVVTLYSAISDIKDNYALNGREQDIRAFIESFHSKVYDEDWRDSDINIRRFYDNTRGGWSERLNENRKNTLKDCMIKELNLKRLDDNRQISEEDKIAAYGKAKHRCQKCGKRFKDYKEAEYHHKDLWSQGGPTDIKNIMVLCQKCHDDIHKNNAAYIPPSEADDEDE